MKKLFLTGLTAVSFFSGWTQDKAALTKEETINYINKKLNETIGKIINNEYLTKNVVALEKDGYLTYTDNMAINNYGDSYSNCSPFSEKKQNLNLKPNTLPK